MAVRFWVIELKKEPYKKFAKDTHFR